MYSLVSIHMTSIALIGQRFFWPSIDQISLYDKASCNSLSIARLAEEQAVWPFASQPLPQSPTPQRGSSFHFSHCYWTSLDISPCLSRFLSRKLEQTGFSSPPPFGKIRANTPKSRVHVRWFPKLHTDFLFLQKFPCFLPYFLCSLP